MALTIAPGSTWRFSDDHGFGPGFVPSGAEVIVTGVYPPGTPGLGAADEDTVLVDYDRPDQAAQSLALPVSLFSQLCTVVA
ncbi:hypothetical protein [Nonomuraea typhae]|uniref:Uncharacterized protein n=1 Tax=Nonomuraea typhae TaxID=2603600 RepID=A0ABW7YJ03_9ACTN